MNVKNTDLNEDSLAGKAIISYLGPVAPHWSIQAIYGDENLMGAFHSRTQARLLLLTHSDPQFRRNQERVERDAEGERISVIWDFGQSNRSNINENNQDEGTQSADSQDEDSHSAGNQENAQESEDAQNDTSESSLDETSEYLSLV